MARRERKYRRDCKTAKIIISQGLGNDEADLSVYARMRVRVTYCWLYVGVGESAGMVR